MARRLLQRSNTAVRVIQVAVPWRSEKTRCPSEGVVLSARPFRATHPAASAAEVLATYRRHRQRLADALSTVPAQTSPRPRPAPPGDDDELTTPEGHPVVDLFAPDLVEAATALYDSKLPYHNARHALRAVACGERLLRACDRADVQVDAKIVRLALLFHDAGYGTDPVTVGCPDAEAYAAALARQALTGRIPAQDVDDVEAAILGTRRTTQPDTPEGKVVRAADLADLAACYDTFAANSEALRVEQGQLSGARVNADEWRKAVDQLLSEYLQERLWPLELLDEDSEQHGFHATARTNLRRYLGQLG